jgi:hypothetical protein
LKILIKKKRKIKKLNIKRIFFIFLVYYVENIEEKNCIGIRGREEKIN